jgi:hypothetical protein
LKTLTEILKRLKMLVIKIISVKGAAFIIASIALLKGMVDGWIWLLITGIVIGARAWEKIKGIVKPNEKSLGDN